MRVACKYCWAIVVETEINFVYNFPSLLYYVSVCLITSLSEVEINVIALKLERHRDDKNEHGPGESGRRRRARCMATQPLAKFWKKNLALPTQTIHIKFLWFSWFLFVCRTALLQRCGFCRASTLSKLREATFLRWDAVRVCVCVQCASLWMHIHFTLGCIAQLFFYGCAVFLSPKN